MCRTRHVHLCLRLVYACVCLVMTDDLITYDIMTYDVMTYDVITYDIITYRVSHKKVTFRNNVFFMINSRLSVIIVLLGVGAGGDINCCNPDTNYFHQLPPTTTNNTKTQPPATTHHHPLPLLPITSH